jgi:hypothetical protein
MKITIDRKYKDDIIQLKTCLSFLLSFHLECYYNYFKEVMLWKKQMEIGCH